MSDCIFCKIIKGEIPTEFLYQDKNIVAFRDINPKAPVNILIVPKKHIEDFITSEEFICNKMLKVAKKLIKKYNLAKIGYRLVVNGGGAALVTHLHMHLLGQITTDRRT